MNILYRKYCDIFSHFQLFSFSEYVLLLLADIGVEPDFALVAFQAQGSRCSEMLFYSHWKWTHLMLYRLKLYVGVQVNECRDITFDTIYCKMFVDT